MKTLVFFILFLVLCHFVGVQWLYTAAHWAYKLTLIGVHGVQVLSK